MTNTKNYAGLAYKPVEELYELYGENEAMRIVAEVTLERFKRDLFRGFEVDKQELIKTCIEVEKRFNTRFKIVQLIRDKLGVFDNEKKSLL